MHLNPLAIRRVGSMVDRSDARSPAKRLPRRECCELSQLYRKFFACLQPRRGKRDKIGPNSYRTSAKISPTLGSKSAKGLIASQSTSISESANARCAATDKSDHHLECQANSTARFKCGGSLRALYLANRPTRLMQVSLQRPPISHASVSARFSQPPVQLPDMCSFFVSLLL